MMEQTVGNPCLKESRNKLCFGGLAVKDNNYQIVATKKESKGKVSKWRKKSVVFKK